MISRIVIAVMTLIITLIVFHNEDSSMILVGVILFISVAVITSFICTPVSRRMIRTGDRITNIFLRILYYIGLLLLLLVTALIFWLLLSAMFSTT